MELAYHARCYKHVKLVDACLLLLHQAIATEPSLRSPETHALWVNGKIQRYE